MLGWSFWSNPKGGFLGGDRNSWIAVASLDSVLSFPIYHALVNLTLRPSDLGFKVKFRESTMCKSHAKNGVYLWFDSL